MFNLTFLSNEKKRALEKLQHRLTSALKPHERSETELLIQEVMSQAKPYQECELDQAEELKNQLLGKISILAGLGKFASVEVFRMHLTEVEFHIATKQMEEKLIEARKKKQPEEPPNMKNKTPTINSMRKEVKKKQAFGHPRWVVGFEDEPDGTNR